jgi:DNA-binding response OmpR family regulator
MAKIFLVEDAADLAQMILRELETAGYEVVHAADRASGRKPEAGRLCISVAALAHMG